MFTTVRFLFLFLPIAFLIYWRCPKGGTGLQNAVLVLASFLFYALWDVDACGLLLAVAALRCFRDFIGMIGLLLDKDSYYA